MMKISELLNKDEQPTNTSLQLNHNVGSVSKSSAINAHVELNNTKNDADWANKLNCETGTQETAITINLTSESASSAENGLVAPAKLDESGTLSPINENNQHYPKLYSAENVLNRSFMQIGAQKYLPENTTTRYLNLSYNDCFFFKSDRTSAEPKIVTFGPYKEVLTASHPLLSKFSKKTKKRETQNYEFEGKPVLPYFQFTHWRYDNELVDPISGETIIGLDGREIYFTSKRIGQRTTQECINDSNEKIQGITRMTWRRRNGETKIPTDTNSNLYFVYLNGENKGQPIKDEENKNIYQFSNHKLITARNSKHGCRYFFTTKIEGEAQKIEVITKKDFDQIQQPSVKKQKLNNHQKQDIVKHSVQPLPPAESKTVTNVFSMFQQGQSVSNIVASLNQSNKKIPQ